MDRMKKRHRQMPTTSCRKCKAALFLDSPDPALRCGIATVNVPRIKCLTWKIDVEGKENSYSRRRATKIRLSRHTTCCARM